MPASDLVRGAYAGKETKLYYNDGTYAIPVWVEIKRARNIQKNRGPALSEVETHGANETGNVPGYVKFAGSFEYARQRGTDTVYDALVTARDSGGIVDICHLNGTVTASTSKGWRAPVLLGESSGTDNGNDGASETFPFAKADAFTDAGAAVNYAAFTGTDP